MAQSDWIIGTRPNKRFSWWTRANAGEVLPDPVTPLAWSLLWERSLLPGWGDGYVSFGCLMPEEAADDPPAMAGVFAGYFYLNLSAVRMSGVRMPGGSVEAIDFSFFGGHPDTPPYAAQPQDESPKCTAALTERLGWIMSVSSWPELEQDADAANEACRNRPDFSSLNDEGLVARARSIVPLGRRLYAHHVWSGLSAGIAHSAATAVLTGLQRPELLTELIAGLGVIESAQPVLALWDLSRQVRESPVLSALFDENVDGLLGRIRVAGQTADASVNAFLGGFEAVIRRYGSRAPTDWDLASPSWEVQPDLPIVLLDRLRLAADDASPRHHGDLLRSRREALTAQLLGQVADSPEVQQGLQATLNAAAFFAAARERTKSNLVRAINEMRLPLHVLAGRHLDDPTDLFLLLDDELDGFVKDPAALVHTLASRRARYRSLFELEPPFFVDQPVAMSALPKRTDRVDPEPARPGTVLTGAPGCSGQATGRARIIVDPYQPDRLQPGDVLVAPLSDPSWTSLFVPAAAVVVDVGSAVSHAVIVSRELGIPCVVSVQDATTRIPDGATVLVDGTAGTVTLL
jgi:pyruvate,water dikinase